MVAQAGHGVVVLWSPLLEVRHRELGDLAFGGETSRWWPRPFPILVCRWLAVCLPRAVRAGGGGGFRRSEDRFQV